MDADENTRARRLNVLTQSSLKALQSCEELFRLRYLERLVPMEEKGYFGIGTGFHAGIEHQSPEAGVQALRDARGEPWTLAESDTLAVDSGVVFAMVEAALAKWDDWPASREVPFQVPLRNPETGGTSTAHVLAGVLDGVYLDALLELKTTSRLDRDYIARLLIDFQVTSYLAAASDALGYPVRRVVYRVVKKPGIKPRQGETAREHQERCEARKPLAPLKQRKTESDPEYEERSRLREEAREPLARKVPESPAEYAERVREDYRTRPDFYCEEVIVTRTDDDIERWRWEVWSMHQRILELERGRFPVRNTGACLDYGRCTFFDLCTGQVGVEAFRVREDAHPELPRAQLLLTGA